jgi:hypothetical protein
VEDNDHTSMNTINTKTSGDHDRIARQYENTARELFAKAGEHKKQLQHYEDKSYLYGRRGQDFRSQAVALERKYKLAAEKATAHAAFHNRMATERVQRDYAAFASLLRPLDNR